MSKPNLIVALEEKTDEIFYWMRENFGVLGLLEEKSVTHESPPLGTKNISTKFV